VRAASASFAQCYTLSSMKCVSILFLRHTSFISYSTQWDERSTGPPPPPAIVVTGLNPLTPYPQVRRHFAQYGTIVAFDGKSDKYTGAPLGIVWVNYGNHELAKHVVEKEDGQRVWLGGEGQVIKVELDSAQQEKCKQRVNAEIVRRKKEQEAKSMRPPPNPLPGASSSSMSTSSAAGAVPQVKGDANASMTGTLLNVSSLQKSGVANTPLPGNGILPLKPNAAFPSAVVNGTTRSISASRMSSEALIDHHRRRGSSRRSPSPSHSPSRSRSRSPSRSPGRARSPTRSPRRPPSPAEPPPPPPQRTIPKPKTAADIQRERDEEHEEILKVLEASGKEHIKIDGLPLGRGVLDRSGMIGLKEADVKEFFDGFEPDQVGHFCLVVVLLAAAATHANTNHLLPSEVGRS
jgi:RNA recognition motif. (a.k.a. RRM, RBD, or RNP domain)